MKVEQEHESTARAPSAPLIHRGSEPSPLSQTAAPHRGLWQSSGPPEWFVSWSGDRGGPSRRTPEQHWAHLPPQPSVRGAAALQVLSCLLLCDQQRSRSPARGEFPAGSCNTTRTHPAGRPMPVTPRTFRTAVGLRRDDGRMARRPTFRTAVGAGREPRVHRAKRAVVQHSTMLTARPPRAVSLYLVIMSAPVSRIVLMTLSRLT